MSKAEQMKVLAGMDEGIHNFHNQVHDIFMKWTCKYFELFENSINDPDYASMFVHHLMRTGVPVYAALTYVTTRFVYMLSQDFSLEKYLGELAKIIENPIKTFEELSKKFAPYGRETKRGSIGRNDA